MNSTEKAILNYLDVQTNLQKAQLALLAKANNIEIEGMDTASSTIKDTWNSVKESGWNPDLYILLYLQLIANTLLFGDDPEVKSKLGVTLFDLGVKVDEVVKKEVELNGKDTVRASKESTPENA